jgi:hypothetical protein
MHLEQQQLKAEIPFLIIVHRIRIGKECRAFSQSLELLFPLVPGNGLCEQNKFFWLIVLRSKRR